jgi:hypothetical protein
VAEQTVYQYVVVLQPKLDNDGNVVEEGQIIVEPTVVLASDADQAMMLAARKIPDGFMDRIGRINVAVRPF